jgi:hypothetical protein
VLGLRRSVLLAVALLLLVPAGVLGMQLAQVADAKGCPSRLVPTPGPVKLRIVVENGLQAGALDATALAAYLSDRAGRPFQVVGVEQADETGFRLAAAARPLSDEVLVFYAHRSSFPNVPTAHGMVDALGFATPGTACAYVSFIPGQPQVCRVLGGLRHIQPGFAYTAHEVGHLMGLSHTQGGLMGKGVFDLCGGDTFSPEQRAQLKAWGR